MREEPDGEEDRGGGRDESGWKGEDAEGMRREEGDGNIQPAPIPHEKKKDARRDKPSCKSLSKMHDVLWKMQRARCMMQDAGREVRDARCRKTKRMQDARWRMRDVRCKSVGREMQGARCRIQNVRCKMQGARSGTQGAWYKMQNAGCEMQDARCRMQAAKCWIEHRRFGTDDAIVRVMSARVVN